MTAKEYLKQAYRLDQRINDDIKEIPRLREMAQSISSITMGDRAQSSKHGEAPFAKRIEKLIDLEKRIDAEIDLLVDLKAQTQRTIADVQDVNDRLVLDCRYIRGMTWEQIGEELHVDKATAWRWHERAIKHVVVPDNPIII